ncbi:MAG: cytochrome B, partial [Rhodobacteraceae bacterium]|nr:cytochrome B [Paracoccaceae bacterium]
MTDAITETSAAAPDRMRVWDAPLRVFHWGLVAAFTLAWLTADEWQTAHEIAGYAVAGLVAFRLVWGFAGNRHARFARFLRGPVATLDYLRDMLARRERRYLGHN